MLRKVGIVALLVFFVAHIAGTLYSQAQSVSVQAVAQQAQIVLPGNALFRAYETRFYQSLELSASEVAQRLQALPTETAAPQSTPASPAMQISILSELKNTDLKTEVVVHGKTLLLGTVEFHQAGSLGGLSLPTGKYGVAAMKGSFVIVIINISNGNVIAFVVISDPLILAFGFVPLFFPFEILFQVAFVIPFPWLFPLLNLPPFFLTLSGCPVLGRAVAVSVPVGSGAVLISSPAAGPPTLAIRESDKLGTLLIESREPEKRPLRFQLLSLGRVALGLVGEGAAGRVHVPVFDQPFVLVASDDRGHSACLSATVLFPGIIAGSATSN
jgi:hypothetical protein